MHKAYQILLILFILNPLRLTGQSHYEVEMVEISSTKYDEFCPVTLKNQLVFCSNKEYELMLSYKNYEERALLNIFSATTDSSGVSKNVEIFSKNLVTPYNDGPVSFSPNGTALVYSRNLLTESKRKNKINLNNKLGLFFAALVNGEWEPTTAFRYNAPDYSITTPCYSPDGRYLYFASDMPGGFGGSDIYCSEKTDSTWSDPVNLGDIINTNGNEVYPFIAPDGTLFFASDGHAGLGKKDIFFSTKPGSVWTPPVHIETPINSPYDDFGLVTDLNFTEGYFSSNRDKTDDIYRFSTALPQLVNCEPQAENLFCFEFWDDMSSEIDSLSVIYEWEFSDSTKIRGIRVEHCFQGGGAYWAKLNIIDNTTGNTFFTQTSMDFTLEDHEQAFITCIDTSDTDTEIAFSGLKSNLPGFSVEQYIWDFGDGNIDSGAEAKHQYSEAGVYDVKLGLAGYEDGSESRRIKCVKRQISIIAKKRGRLRGKSAKTILNGRIDLSR